MKSFLPSILSILVFSSIVQAQNPSSTGYTPKETDAKQKLLDKGKDYDVNFDISNHEAFFLEGEDSLFSYLYHHLEITEEAYNANLVANAMIGFQVNFDGNVQESYSISKVGFGIDEQLIKILDELEFVPATQGDIPYRSEIVFEIPIKAGYLYNLKK
ncbi:MAG: hypothetical protein WED33_09655 [Bacteroidia bacterium]